jgi:hypothetical protein
MTMLLVWQHHVGIRAAKEHWRKVRRQKKDEKDQNNYKEDAERTRGGRTRWDLSQWRLSRCFERSKSRCLLHFALKCCTAGNPNRQTPNDGMSLATCCH